MNVTELQTRLKAAGFDPGTIDGAMGRDTANAIRAFQKAKGLPVDGVASPAVIAALTGGGAPAPAPAATATLAPLSQPWMIEAMRCIGITEDTSARSNPVIVGWGKALRIDYRDDAVAWCGLFAAHCIGSQLTAEPLPINPLGARNWAKLGVPCPVPQPGAVMVFWRKSKASGLGHVAFYVGEDATTFHVVGGNQADRVSVTRMPRDRFVEARWPRTAPPPTGGPRRVSASGAVSTNEA